MEIVEKQEEEGKNNEGKCGKSEKKQGKTGENGKLQLYICTCRAHSSRDPLWYLLFSVSDCFETADDDRLLRRGGPSSAIGEPQARLHGAGFAHGNEPTPKALRRLVDSADKSSGQYAGYSFRKKIIGNALRAESKKRMFSN